MAFAFPFQEDHREEDYFLVNVPLSAWDRLHPGEHAYHVTCFAAMNKFAHPDIPYLKGNVAASAQYDRSLKGVTGVFLSTSLNAYSCDLPDKTQYPSGGSSGQSYWRVKVPLKQFCDYEISLVSEAPNQILLILTIGHEQTQYFRSLPGITALVPAENDYLCRRGQEWRVNAYRKVPKNAREDPYFVNFFLPTDRFPLRDVVWDVVEHF